MRTQTVNADAATPQVKQMWMTWMRTNHPDIYHAALQATIAPIFDLSASMLAGMARGNALGRLSALGQDITDLTSDPTAVDLSLPTDTTAISAIAAAPATINYSASSLSSNVTPAPAQGASVSSIPAVNTLFNTLVATAANVATNALTGNSAALVQENAVRVQQGLPPLNPDGSVMTVAQMQAAGYTSAQIQQIESTLSGGLTLNTTTLLLIGGAVLLFVMMSKKG